MKLCGLAKYVLTITMGAAMLAACNNNGGASLAPPRASSALPGITHTVRSQPTTLKGTGPYQYIVNWGYGSGSTISVFDYPKSDAQIGSISSVPSPVSECTNVLFGSGKETFWVTSASGYSAGALYEFKVGVNRPIKTLTTPSGDGPHGCAIDPATGNLVAAIHNNGAVVIYKKASGKGTVSQTPLSKAWFAGFDNKSNLYVDGDSTNGFGFVELPKGSKSWKTLSVSTASGSLARCSLTANT